MAGNDERTMQHTNRGPHPETIALFVIFEPLGSKMTNHVLRLAARQSEVCPTCAARLPNQSEEESIFIKPFPPRCQCITPKLLA